MLMTRINKPVIWKPESKPQRDFCSSPVFEVCIGGAAGGGKSDPLLMEGLRQIDIPEYRAIMFRRTTKQLRKLIDRSFEVFKKICPLASWSDQKSTWIFPSGAKYLLWHMEHEKNKLDHDGQEYQYIAFDELTSFSETQYTYLFARCRTSSPNLKCYVRASAMPMGEGISWVKQRFIDNGPYKIITDKETGLKRQFIPAKLEDNKFITENDPDYEKRLKLMGPKLYHALRHGDWSIIEGACFEELNREDHCIKPTMPPKGAQVFRALDWGYMSPFSIGWYFVDCDGIITRFMEWYGWNGQPNTGLRMGAGDVAKKILKLERELGLNISYGIADSEIWGKEDEGPTTYEYFRDAGITWQKANKARIQGKMEFHNRLAKDDDGRVKFKVTENCKHWWRTIPMLQADKHKPEDVSTIMEDHCYDETRYFFMSRPTLTGQGKIAVGEDRATASMDW